MANMKKGGASSPAPNSMMLRRTLGLLIVCGIVAFLVLVGRLVKLQIIDHDLYENAAIGQQVRETTVSANRGTIYDTNGKILAKSATAYTVNISPREINMYDTSEENDKAVTHEFIAQGLAEILDIDSASILEKMSDSKSWYKTIARKIEPEVADEVRAFKNEYGLIGVRLDEDSKRYYPYSSLAAQVIGFVGSENTGLYGLEKLYDKELSGVNGRVVRAKTAVGVDMLITSFEDYVDAMSGNNMYIAMDATIEYYLEKHLEQAVADYDVQNGAAAIAMNVRTGGVLGMVSLGDFDLNNYQEISEEARAKIDAALQAETDEEKRKELESELVGAARLLQWRNKAISDTYEPGSTFKIITLAIALNEGLVNENSTFYCGGSIKVTGDAEARKCWKTGGHGSQTLTQCLQHSCNVAFIEMGQMIGAEKFYEYCEAFGLFDGTENKDAYRSGMTGIDLLGESGSIWWPYNEFCGPNKSQLAAASFGQTFTITPIQLITAVSACTNGGYLMKPYVVQEITDENGETVSKTEPTVIRQVISEATSAKVRAMLEQVVGDSVEGTGKNAAVAGYRIGGKTGTSEKTAQDAAGGPKEYIVSFLGVAPMDDPEIAILVLLDTPSNSSGVYISGGQMGAPTVGKMMADILPYMGYEPDYSEDEKDTIDRSVPSVSGLTVEEAAARLAEAGFTYRTIGSGTTVTGQLPAANAVIAADSQVIIYCGDSGPSEATEIMPNLTNMSYSVARQHLGVYALFIRSAGSVTNPSNLMVTSQSVAPGSVVTHGTVIEVTVVDSSELGIY